MPKTFIIAEAGVNHNGSLSLAKKLIDQAAWAGADAVKFQTFKTENLVTESAQKAAYQKVSTDRKESQFAMLKKLELSDDAQRALLGYCKKNKIQFLSSPFDLDSVDFLAGLGLKIFKIPSGEITNLPYLRKVGKLGVKVILSTGMSYLNEVREAIEVLRSSGTRLKDIIVLHCHTEYPTDYKDVNLRAMRTMQKELNVTVGYSDHTPGIIVPAIAVALGACVIEKHFTLDRTMEGPDHKASLVPAELKAMVLAIRAAEQVLGDGIKKPTQVELRNKPIGRKSIVALKHIQKGEIFNEHNLTVKRPGTGIDPMSWDKILGTAAKKNFKPDQMIEL